ncbi:MAG: agl cluster protein AglQ [Thermodesulfobacteriota bacterium]
MRLSDLIVQSASAALDIQREDGSFPPGHNGPYHDSETPVRNTAHWLVTLLKAHELSGGDAFVGSARRAAEYLASPEARPMGATFHCRTNPEMDSCNGLVGQAWVIEALAAAGSRLGERGYSELAEEVFLLHPFNEGRGLWTVVNMDGSKANAIKAFNQHLWLAAAASLIDGKKDELIKERVNRFMDLLPENLSLRRSGRIVHNMESGRQERKYLYRRLFRTGPEKPRPIGRGKETGYHAFNLYAFAILKEYLPDHPFWSSKKFARALGFVNRTEFIDRLEGDEYGFGYNPVGFEVACAAQVFPSFFASERGASWWVNEQLRRCYYPGEKMMSRTGADGLTLAARLYECTRLEDMEVEL